MDGWTGFGYQGGAFQSKGMKDGRVNIRTSHCRECQRPDTCTRQLSTFRKRIQPNQQPGFFLPRACLSVFSQTFTLLYLCG